MKLQHSSLRKLLAIGLLLTVVLLMAGCGSLGGDQNTFSPSGDVAQKQLNLFLLVLIPATIILIGVTVALVFILFRFRRREGDAIPAQIHGNNRLEIGWTIAPTILLAGVAVITVAGIIDLGRDAAEDALHVNVVAFQWDWRFEYLDPEYIDEDDKPLTTNNLYIPVDREVSVDLEALDVIHSFWVPKLAGKRDVMPGQTNSMWFNATEPGIYAGQCAEFCGIGHAVMKFQVIALEASQFDACMEAVATEGDAQDPPEECAA